MAVVDIQSELAARNPRGAKDQIAKRLEAIDETITMLGFAADSAAMAEQPDDNLVRGLILVHKRLRRECDRLFALL